MVVVAGSVVVGALLTVVEVGTGFFAAFTVGRGVKISGALGAVDVLVALAWLFEPAPHAASSVAPMRKRLNASSRG